jgi:hypothetical protein
MENKNSEKVRIVTAFAPTFRILGADVVRAERGHLVKNGESIHLRVIVGRLEREGDEVEWDEKIQNYRRVWKGKLEDRDNHGAMVYIDEIQAEIIISKSAAEMLLDGLKNAINPVMK